MRIARRRPQEIVARYDGAAAASALHPASAVRMPSMPPTPDAVRALQQTAGNQAVQRMLLIQRGRTKKVRAGVDKERNRKKTWKAGRKWPENQLKGLILERTDKYVIRKRGKGYVSMNKVMANFPAIDGIADGRFRQVKAYLAPDGSPKAKKNAVQRIVAEVEKLEEKCETAARDLVGHDARLLQELLNIDAGKSSTKHRTGTAPYEEKSSEPAARDRHKDVLPPDFRDLATLQLKQRKEDPDFDFDTDALAQAMMEAMVVVVPDELVADVSKEVAKTRIAVEPGGFSSEALKEMMDAVGYEPSRRGARDEAEEDPDYT